MMIYIIRFFTYTMLSVYDLIKVFDKVAQTTFLVYFNKIFLYETINMISS